MDVEGELPFDSVTDFTVALLWLQLRVSFTPRIMKRTPLLILLVIPVRETGDSLRCVV